MADIPLSDFLNALRDELVKSALDSPNQLIRFVAEKAEVELTIAAERTGTGKAGVSFKVFGIGADLGAEGTKRSEVTQKLTLTLSPVDMNTGEHPYISAKGKGPGATPATGTPDPSNKGKGPAGA